MDLVFYNEFGVCASVYFEQVQYSSQLFDVWLYEEIKNKNISIGRSLFCQYQTYTDISLLIIVVILIHNNTTIYGFVWRVIPQIRATFYCCIHNFKIIICFFFVVNNSELQSCRVGYKRKKNDDLCLGLYWRKKVFIKFNFFWTFYKL